MLVTGRIQAPNVSLRGCSTGLSGIKGLLEPAGCRDCSQWTEKLANCLLGELVQKSLPGRKFTEVGDRRVLSVDSRVPSGGTAHLLIQSSGSFRQVMSMIQFFCQHALPVFAGAVFSGFVLPGHAVVAQLIAVLLPTLRKTRWQPFGSPGSRLQTLLKEISISPATTILFRFTTNPRNEQAVSIWTFASKLCPG